MKYKVIRTTDNKFLWNIFEVDELNIPVAEAVTGFKFDIMKVDWNEYTFISSNYTWVIKQI